MRTSRTIEKLLRYPVVRGSNGVWANGHSGLVIRNVLKLALILTSSAQAQPFTYVTNSNSSSVSMIDTATNVVIATVGVRGRPVAVAINPDGSRG